MPDNVQHYGDHLFIVRLRHESSGSDVWPWRGSVEHIPSGQRLNFATLADLSDFITWRLDKPARLTSDG